MKYLIIGNGVAGTEAALTLRKKQPDCDVTIVTDSTDRFYFRPRLIECLGAHFDYERIFVHADEYFVKNDIAIHYGCKVVSIDRSAKRLHCVGDVSFAYDKLLIAAGALPFVPPIENTDIKGFFTLRSINDAKRINEFCTGADHVLIAGGGLLGLECAHSLLQAVKKVSVVESEPFLLQRQLDGEGGMFLANRLKQSGLEFIFNDKIVRLDGGNSLEKVVFNSGEMMDASALIMSTGIRSETVFAAECGLSVSRGICVDKTMRTNDPDVFAAGDCAEVDGRVYGLWMASKEQGRIAALSITGSNERFSDEPAPVMLKIPGVDLFCAGDLRNESCEILRSVTEERYAQLAIEGSEVKGIAVIGDKKLVALARNLLQGSVSLKDFSNAVGF